MKKLLPIIGVLAAMAAAPVVTKESAKEKRMAAVIADPPKSGLKELWVVSPNALSPAEQVLAQSLQGLTGRENPRIWLRSGSMYKVVKDQLRREGVNLREAEFIWELLREFRPQVKGMILYRLGTPSLNVATSLAGIMDGVAIDESLRQKAEEAGLSLLADAREMSEEETLEKYKDRFAKGILVEQSVEKPGHLRDFAIARRAFTFSAKDPAFRTKAAKTLGPNALVFGWGPDEHEWVRDLSRANATGAPADWSLNLSAFGKLPAGKLERPKRPIIKTEEGVRYIAFVMSDGDNLQWLAGNFIDHSFYWGSPLRGEFPMTWEVSPLLPTFAPRILQRIYATAKPTDGFVTGPGVPGYTFLHDQPDREALARQAAPYLRASDLSVVSTLNANEGSLKETIPLLELPDVKGVIYKDYSPYHRRKGEIFWHRGKPTVSYKMVLWGGLMEPEQIAEEVSKMPARPRTDEGSYALINVHAWSYGDQGGPMAAIQRTIEMLPENARVVTADQIIEMLRRNFGEKRKSE